MRAKVIFLFIMCLLTGCLGFDTKEKVVGNYYLVATDDEVQLSLSYCDPADKNGCVGITEPTVFAVGYNKDYIIAKQHPYNAKNITNYFILPIDPKRKSKWGDNFGLIGPLTLEQFNDEKRELNMSDSLKFSVVKDHLK